MMKKCRVSLISAGEALLRLNKGEVNVNILKKIGPYLFLFALVLFMYFFKVDAELSTTEEVEINSALNTPPEVEEENTNTQ